MIFDLIASEYGYTFDQIMEMSLKEIDVAMRYIPMRSHNEYARKAALHGVKIPVQRVRPSTKPNSFTDEEQAAADNLMAKRMQRRVRVPNGQPRKS